MPVFIGDGDWIESKDQSESGIRLIQTGNVGFGKFRDKEGKYHFISDETFEKLSCCEIFSGDILISRLPEPVGRACIVPNTNSRMITAVDCTILRLNEKLICPEYFVYYTQSTKYMELIKQVCTGTTRLRISRANLEKILIPLPPKEEQCLILKEITHYFSFIENIEIDKDELSVIIKQTKSKILDLAIHGKLVPQDSSDEPASVLLENLRTEKEAKIQAGELKRDKNDSYIYKNTTDNCYYQKFADGKEVDITDEIPYEVPSSWEWCRFGNYLDVRDGTHDSPKYVDNGFPFVTSKNLIDGKIDFSDVKYISEKDHKNFIQRSFVEDGDILFAMIGSIGNPVLVKKDREFSIKNVALFKPLSKSLNYMKYVFFFADHIQTELTKKAKGGMQPFVPLSFFRKDLWIPIPPLAEQKRIVEKIENFYSILDKIAENLA